PSSLIKIAPSIKCGSWDSDLLQRPPNRQMGLLDELDDLQLLCGRISHSPSSPSPVTLFLRTRFSRVRSATTSLSAMASRRRSLTSSEVAARAVSQGGTPALRALSIRIWNGRRPPGLPRGLEVIY